MKKYKNETVVALQNPAAERANKNTVIAVLIINVCIHRFNRQSDPIR